MRNDHAIRSTAEVNHAAVHGSTAPYMNAGVRR